MPSHITTFGTYAAGSLYRAPLGSTNKLTFTVVKPGGLFNGTVTVPETGKVQSFNGALFPKGTNGSGCFLGTNEPRVWLGPGE